MIDIFEKCSNPAKVIFFSPLHNKHYTKIKMIDILEKPPNPPKMNFLPQTHIKLPQTIIYEKNPQTQKYKQKVPQTKKK